MSAPWELSDWEEVDNQDQKHHVKGSQPGDRRWRRIRPWPQLLLLWHDGHQRCGQARDEGAQGQVQHRGF